MAHEAAKTELDFRGSAPRAGIGKGAIRDGAGDPSRTDDLLFTRQLLYQLSYAGIRQAVF